MCAGSKDHGDDWWGPKHGPSCWCLPAEDPTPADDAEGDAEGDAALTDGVGMQDDGGELDPSQFCHPVSSAAASPSADADGEEEEPSEEERRSLEAAVHGNNDAIATNATLIKALRDALG